MAVFAFLFGLFWGSFLNVLIDRLPKGENVLWGRSHCDYCKRELRWFELIPLLSYLLQRGRCLRCKGRLSWQYPLIELLTGIGLGIIAATYGYSLPLVGAGSLVFSSFLVIFIADVKYQIIPDSTVITGLVGSVLWLWFDTSRSFYWSHIMAAAVSFLLFLSLWFITKKRGIGLGDVKLSFVLGLLMGYPEIVMALYVAFLTGALVGVILILLGNKTMKSKIAFGPFLVLGTAIIIVFHTSCINLWNTIF